MKLLSKSSKIKARHGFTLIELLAVIGIIALLAGILVPTVSKALESGRRAKAASHLRQICLAYAAYSMEGGNARSIAADNPHNWAATLARNGGPNEGALYWVDGDPAITHIPGHPVTVLQGSSTNLQSRPINNAFLKIPLSYTMAANLPAQAPASTTPVVWTRGLQADGTWSTDSPFKGQGGYIGFLDGHVTWYPNLNGSDNKGALLDHQSLAPTKSIKAAIGAATML